MARKLPGSIAMLTLAAALAWSGPALADPAADKTAVDAVLDQNYPRLDALYKDIHAHPELAFQEVATAAKLAKEMRRLGYTVTEKVGQTGLVAILKNGAGPTVLIRTDLDALPMKENTGLPYASQARAVYEGKETYVDHSCGHDIHMASWIGTAQALAALKTRWSGTVMFVGQPGEESGRGAKAMMDDRLYERFGKPDYALGLHVMPAPYNLILSRPGPTSTGYARFDLTFKGKGGHGATPWMAIDPVMMAARFLVDVQPVVSQEKDAGAFGVMTVGSFQAGSAPQIIPGEAKLSGTIRTLEPPVQAKIVAGITRTANATAAMAGAPAPTVAIGPVLQPIRNDAALTARVQAAFKAAFGNGALPMPIVPSASEDFSEYGAGGVPTFFFWIGGYPPGSGGFGGTKNPPNHSPEFAPVPEPTIRHGVEAMTVAVMSVAHP